MFISEKYIFFTRSCFGNSKNNQGWICSRLIGVYENYGGNSGWSEFDSKQLILSLMMLIMFHGF